ncbi:MAG: DUF2892 domain-containing protein [Desulfobacterales bacterium]|nr:DUF2892 domain-containing protein [Desulfobacterales bacterium]
MNLDRLIFRIAGIVILISLLLAVTHSLYWLLLTALIGANMLQASFTGICPTAKIFKVFGVKPGQLFD